MQKSSLLLLLAGGLIIGGLGLSVWGNQIIFEDFIKKEGSIAPGESMMVEATMEESGVFAVEVLGSDEGEIFVSIKDPNGNSISQDTVKQKVFEGYFDVDVFGNYTLIIENQGRDDVLVAGYIGPEPDASKRTIAFLSIYVLIVGLVGIVIAIIYSVVKRKS